MWSVNTFPWEQHTFNHYVWPAHLRSVGVMRTASAWMHIIHFFGDEARRTYALGTLEKGRTL